MWSESYSEPTIESIIGEASGQFDTRKVLCTLIIMWDNVCLF